MNQILYTESTTDNSEEMIVRKPYKKIFVIISIVITIIVATIIVPSLSVNGKILANVYIGDVDVGFKSKEEAISLIKPELENFKGKNIRLTLGSSFLDITDEDIGLTLENDVENMINEAYDHGRKGNFITNATSIVSSYFNDNVITPSYKIDDSKLAKIFKKIGSGENFLAANDEYEIKENKLYIRRGCTGQKIDEKLAEKYIITAFLNNVDSVDIPTIEDESKKVDLDSIYMEVYVEPQNARVSIENGYEVVLEEKGKNFDLAKAKELYRTLAENESLTIDIIETEPEIKVSDLDIDLFSSVLATLETKYDPKDENRVTNLKVASERCNNIILYPGDEFSYNKALGRRTVANGFAPGHSFAGGKVVTTIGGGICQVSSTLYNVVLMADLEITNRVAHGMYVEYVKPSLDATVVDGAIDFKFKNNRKYPVKIEATAENGIVKVSILGIKDANEPIVEIESVVLETLEYKTVRENDSSMKKGETKVVQDPVEGYRSEAYRIVKDADGNVISRTLISRDRYIPTNEIIKVGTKEDIVIPETPVEPELPEEIESETPTYEEEKELPPGWDSPESPYANGN